jgi:predicted component of type VI protein secretion system
MDFELHVVRGRSTAQALRLADGVNTVGRHDQCQIRIKSSQVSRKHCELFEKNGLLLVKDLGSANGTFVNGKKVEGQQVLEPGDELTIGGVKLKVSKAGQPLAPKAPAKAAGDTAVAEAIPVAETADDEEFEIDFDDEPEVSADIEDAIELALSGDHGPAPEPKTEPPAAAMAPEPKKPPEPQPAPAPEPAAEGADEAIADFLLDIKIDEEE